MSWTNITNAQLAIGAPIRSIDLLALRDNIISVRDAMNRAQIFTSSGNFVVPDGVSAVKVSINGGGGGGGVVYGNGGGSGSGNGGNGGSSSFGGYVTCGGGGGGIGGYQAIAVGGSAGSAGSAGAFVSAGSAGSADGTSGDSAGVKLYMVGSGFGKPVDTNTATGSYGAGGAGTTGYNGGPGGGGGGGGASVYWITGLISGSVIPVTIGAGGSISPNGGGKVGQSGYCIVEF